MWLFSYKTISRKGGKWTSLSFYVLAYWIKELSKKSDLVYTSKSHSEDMLTFKVLTYVPLAKGLSNPAKYERIPHRLSEDFNPYIPRIFKTTCVHFD